ncbi:MAG: hypothetical protein LBJ93_03710 [Clostridiales bacterium]|jgi:hypothetical protein|nr:hypothetical protein [Clostridiales bacterium]
MSKFLSGCIIGSIMTLVGTTLICENKRECRKHGKKFLNKTADMFDHVSHKI